MPEFVLDLRGGSPDLRAALEGAPSPPAWLLPAAVLLRGVTSAHTLQLQLHHARCDASSMSLPCCRAAPGARHRCDLPPRN